MEGNISFKCEVSKSSNRFKQRQHIWCCYVVFSDYSIVQVYVHLLVRSIIIMYCLTMKARTCPLVDYDFSGARQQFPLDALPDATNDSLSLQHIIQFILSILTAIFQVHLG